MSWFLPYTEPLSKSGESSRHSRKFLFDHQLAIKSNKQRLQWQQMTKDIDFTEFIIQEIRETNRNSNNNKEKKQNTVVGVEGILFSELPHYII